MNAKPVAAVYDRRMENEPTLTERRYRAVYERRAENETGAHRAPQQVVAAVYDRRPPVLAERRYRAVYDRRMENETGAHRAPQQVVAAVYDRRMENEPTLAERRYRAVYDRRDLYYLAGFICFFLFSLLLSAAPKKDAVPPVDPTVVYDATVKVLRGGTCEVPLRAISPQGYDVEFKIISQPRSGSLFSPQRNSKSSVSYFYTHDGNKNSFQDSFRFKCKSGPQKAWGYAKATILVEEPPARFAADVSALDFGSVFLGESRTLPIRIKNAGGGRLQGRLKVSAPWSFAGPADLALSEGETQKILATFAPLSTDTQRGSLVFEHGSKPFPEITLEGVGESRFEAPEKSAFEQRVGANELRIPITNHTAAPLPISIHCPPPLEAPDAISLAPESTGELLLKLPARPFAEKNSLVTLSDGASTRDIRIQLPPAPSLLQWEINGKNQLGVKSPGRIDPLSATLRNTGSTTASAVLRVSGDGMSLAPDQASNLTIAPGEIATVNAVWKFPDMPGRVEAALVAETDGLPPVKTSWEADVQSVAEPAPRSSKPAPVPAADDTPPPPTAKVLTKEEREALRKLRPSDASSRLEPELHWTAFFPTRRTATAIVSWSYEGPPPVEFVIQLQVHQRKGFFDKNPFERPLPTTETLPAQSLEPVWTPLDPSIAKIQKLPDGRWQARIPALYPGYHNIRVIAKTLNTNRMDGSEFNIFVGDIPLPQPLPWTLPVLFIICVSYLLRKKIRSLFG
jgi:hypothetical protein